MMRITIAAGLFAALLAVAAPAAAASFDCARAGSAVERTICGDTGLSRLDEVFAEAYRQARSAAATPDALRAQQLAWLRAERDACRDSGCIDRVYRKRIGLLHGLAGFAAANGMREDRLADVLRTELELHESERILFVPVRSATVTAPATIVFFARGPDRAQMFRGVADVSANTPRVIAWEPFACHCDSLIAATAVRLVADRPDFVVARYVPRTGSCIAAERTEIFRIGSGGDFVPVWDGTNYAAGGPEAEIADIGFPGLGAGPDRAVLRAAKRVRCGDDDCFCRDGVVVDEYVELFLWDRVEQRFRSAQ